MQNKAQIANLCQRGMAKTEGDRGEKGIKNIATQTTRKDFPRYGINSATARGKWLIEEIFI